MITQATIDLAIKYLKKHEGVLPLPLKKLNLTTKRNKLYVDGREAVPQDRIQSVIKEYDQDAKTTGGIKRLYEHISRDLWGISLDDVRHYVQHSSAHQVHQPLPKKTTSRVILTKGPNQVVQVDLFDMSNLQRPEKYAFTAIDIFSKHAWAFAIRNKEAATVAATLDAMLRSMKQKPKTIQTDRGSEFEKAFDTILAKHGVRHVRSLAYNPTANSGVERLNGSIKKDLFRLMTQKKTTDWASLLPGVVENHNNSVSRSTGKAPNDVTQEDAQGIKDKLTKNAEQSERTKRVFAVGDHVRIALTALDRKSAGFRKGARQNWSDDVHQVRSVSKPMAAGSEQQYLLQGSKKRYWAYQLLRVPEATVTDHEKTHVPDKEEKLDSLSDDEFEPPRAARNVDKKEAVGKRPQRNRAKRIMHGDYVYLG